MGTTKILVVANSPGILHRMVETLAGLEVQTAVRLRDAAKAVKESHFGLVVFCLGFDEQSAVDFFASFAAEPADGRPAVACVAPEEMPRASLRQVEMRLRAAGANDFVELRNYPRTRQGNEQLRVRLLASMSG